MSEPVEIVVTAQTGQAAAALKNLGVEGQSAFRQVREGAMLAHEGMRSLEGTLLLVGGTRFPEFTVGAMVAIQAVKGLRTASMLTGVAMSTMLPILGGLAAAVGAGALVWGAMKSEQDRARESADELAESYKQMPELINRINDAHQAGALSAADQQRMLTSLGVIKPGQSALSAMPLTMAAGTQQGQPNAQAPLRMSTSQLGIPDHNDIRLTNEELVKLGVLLKQVDDKGAVTYTLNPQIAALQKIAELRQRITVETLTGYDKERAAVGQKYEAEMSELNKQFEIAGNKQDPAEAQELRLKLATGLANELASIDKKQAEESVKCDEDAIRQTQENQKAYSEWLKKQKEKDLKAIVELQEQHRDDLMQKKFDVQANPFMSDSDKAGATSQILQQQMALARTEQERLGYEKQLQQLMVSQTATGQWGAMVTQLQNLNNLARESAQLFSSVFNTAVNSITHGITGLIEGTMSWGKAIRQIGISVVNDLISGFVHMVVQWTLQHTLMAAVSKIFHVQETATQAAATGTQVGIHTAGEVAKTGASAGGTSARTGLMLFETIFHGVQVGIRTIAHVAGEIMMTAVTMVQSAIRLGVILVESMAYIIMAAVEALAAIAAIPYIGPFLAPAVAAGILAAGVELLGNREAGGPVEAGSPYIVGERGQELFVPDTAGKIFSHENTISMLSGRGDSGGAGSGAGSGAGGSSPQVHVIVVNDQNEALKAIRSAGGEKAVLAHVANNKLRLGIKT